MIEVKKEVFARYLDLIMLKGESNSREAVVSSSKDSNEVLLVTSNKVVGLRGTYKLGLGDLGTIGLDNIKIISDFVKTIPTKDISIEVASNKLVVRSQDKNSVLKATLRSPEYILNTIDSKKFDALVSKAGEGRITIKGSDISNIINYLSIITAANVTLKKVDNVLQIRVGDDQNDIGAKLTVEGTCDDFTVKLPNLWIDLLSVVGSNDLIIGSQENAPLYMKVDTKEYMFEYIVSPTV